MTIRELIGGQVVEIEATSSLREATMLMAESEVGALAVRTDGRLSGILTERDVLHACARGVDLDAKPVHDWMTSDPDSLDPDMGVEAAADWMLAAGYRHLPVVENSGLVGMVSIKDILWAITGPSGA